MKIDWKKWFPHLIALAVLLVVTLAYFNPVLKGYTLKTHDLKMHKGMSKEVADFRLRTGEEALWTDSMFGGMPATQISVRYDSNLMNYVYKVITLGMPAPAGIVWMYFLGFYILLCCLRINPWLGILGALAFGFSSYFFIILEAGHMSKAVAIAFIPPMIGGVILAFRGKLLMGAILTCFFMSLELKANHYQITYYFLFVILIYGISELVQSIQKGKLLEYGKTVAALFIAVGIAIVVNIGNIWGTTEYTKYTTRGPSELTIKSPGEKTGNKTSGLDRDYITQWSYGRQETLSLLVPNAKGGGSDIILNRIGKKMQKGEELTEVERVALSQYQGSSRYMVKEYYGNQPIVSGPVYIGAVVMLLAFLAIFLVPSPLVISLFIASFLTVCLSWGKNMQWFTDIFIDYVPGYNKFRAVSMILVVAEFCMPLMGVLFLKELIEKRELLAGKKNLIYGAGGFFVLFLLVMAFAQPGMDFMSNQEQLVDFNTDKISIPQGMPESDIAQYQITRKLELENDVPIILDYRKSKFKSDALRSFGFSAVALLLIVLFVLGKASDKVLLGGVGVLILADLAGVNMRYLNNNKEDGVYESWVKSDEEKRPYTASKAHYDIGFYEMAETSGKIDQVYGALNQLYAAKQGKVSPQEERAVWSEQLKDHPTMAAISQGYKNHAELTGEDLSNSEMEGVWFSELSRNHHFRVMDYSASFNNDAGASYFFKSVGGYHGAKLKRYQELIDFHIIRGNQRVLDMLNTKYLLGKQENQIVMQPRKSALGAAWIVGDVNFVDNADAEILALADSNGFDPANTAVVDVRFKDLVGEVTSRDNGAKVELTSYEPNELVYTFKGASDQVVVFSEIFYDLGWQAEIDGKPVDHFRTNYVLRGLKVPSGEHEIRFKYALKSFDVGGVLMLVSSALVILLLGFGIYKSLSKSDNEELKTT